MDSEGDVLKHHQTVCHSNPSKNKVDGVGPHVLVGKHQYVDYVKDSAYTTDRHGKIAMEWKISFLQVDIVELYKSVRQILP